MPIFTNCSLFKTVLRFTSLSGSGPDSSGALVSVPPPLVVRRFVRMKLIICS